MSINIENKQKDINNFMNEKYFPLLKEYEVSEEELNNIVQNIVNNLNNEEYVEQLDTEDYRSLEKQSLLLYRNNVKRMVFLWKIIV